MNFPLARKRFFPPSPQQLVQRFTQARSMAVISGNSSGTVKKEELVYFLHELPRCRHQSSGAAKGERTGWEIIPKWKRAELRDADGYPVLMIIFEQLLSSLYETILKACQLSELIILFSLNQFDLCFFTTKLWTNIVANANRFINVNLHF